MRTPTLRVACSVAPQHSALLVRRCLSAIPHDAMTGSSYENYSVTSQTYDAYRKPISLDLFREAFRSVARRMSKETSALDLLDALCDGDSCARGAGQNARGRVCAAQNARSLPSASAAASSRFSRRCCFFSSISRSR